MTNQKKLSLILPYDNDFDIELLENIYCPILKIELIVSAPIESNIKDGLVTRVLSYKNKKDYINNAIIIAAGYWIAILDSIDDTQNIQSIIALVEEDIIADAVAGNASRGIKNKVGIRDITRTKPVVFKREFLAELLPLKLNSNNNVVINHAVKIADNNSSLLLRKDYIGVSNYFGKKVRLLRPYHKIAQKKYGRSPKLKNNKSIVTDITYNKNIPVFINCRDRYAPLLKLIDWLEIEGFTNIILIDNLSTYAPLLSYYKKTPYTVISLGQNIGQRAPWLSGAINLYANDKAFIVTDPDVLPEKNSHGAIKKFVKILNEHKSYCKVGFGLRIDNLPGHFALKDSVINWESQFWKKEIDKDLYDADLDTTFALYRPNTKYAIRPALRTGGKYVAEHEPWYIESDSPNDEVMYYRKHANKDIGSWGFTNSDMAEVYKQNDAKIKS